MGDEEQRHAHFLLQAAHQAEHLGLHRDVKRRGGFVGNQQPRAAGQRDGDHHALAHAAGKLERIAVELARGLGDAHPLQHAPGFLAGGGLAQALMQHDRLGDLVTHAQHGIEAGHRLLEDHGDLRAAERAHAVLCFTREVQGFTAAGDKADASGIDLSTRIVEQPGDGERGDGFAGAGFADDGDGFAFVDGEVEIPHHGGSAGSAGKLMVRFDVARSIG